MIAIFKREVKSYFYSPVGYICVAVIAALYGFAYSGYVMSTYSTSYITNVYSYLFTFCMMIIPILTMRSMSEEQRNKTDQALLTAPVGVTSIVMGKFLAAYFVFFLASVLGLLPAFSLVPFVTGAMPWGIIIGNFIGTLLYGGAMISIGIFISSLTESQVIAAIGSFVISVLLMYIEGIASSVGNAVVSKVVSWISFSSRYNLFVKGIFSIPSTVFFISVMAVFVFFTSRKVESRRWS